MPYKDRSVKPSCVDVGKLRGILAERSIEKQELASIIGMKPATFYDKMRTGFFTCQEAKDVSTALSFTNEMILDIFLGITSTK